MELNPDTITGDWASFEDGEYFVYKTGDMLGFCVIGEHEPCFSVSTFFSKNDDAYKSQYEKFSSLLQNLKQQIEETENKLKGGEQPMNEFENNQTVVESEVTPETEVKETETEQANFEVEAEVEVAEKPVAEEVSEPEVEAEPEAEAEAEPEAEAEVKEEPEAAEPSEFEQLQQSLSELQSAFNALQLQFTEANESIVSLNNQLNELRSENDNLLQQVANYQAIEAQNEIARKNSLIEKYEKVLNEEEINPIKDMVKDFSYDELEGKLAVLFANKQMAGSDESKKVPLPEPEQENEFALLMKKYRK